MHKMHIYLHIIHLLKSSTCFKHYSSHHQEVYVVILHMQPLLLSLSAGDCLVHRLTGNSSSLVDLQLAQNSCFFTYNTLLKCSTCFEHYPAHLQEVYVVIVYMQPLVSSLSAAGDCRGF